MARLADSARSVAASTARAAPASDQAWKTARPANNARPTSGTRLETEIFAEMRISARRRPMERFLGEMAWNTNVWVGRQQTRRAKTDVTPNSQQQHGKKT